MKALWISVLCVVLSAVIGWGAWATISTTGATPRVIFDQHVKETEDKFDAVQQRIEDKLDKIQDTIIELHKE
jgi:hypothetical protein